MIRFNDVNKIYNPNKNNEYHALKNVNLTIKDTGLVLLVGKSGSGKTTLLNLISGLDKISSGTLEISYKEPYASFLFQDAQLLEQYTVKENLLLAMNISNHKVDISTYIKKYELEGLLNHKANELSSGQKMRVAFVRAILCNRPILICDEPTGALDSINAKIMAEELIHASRERLVIVASHDPELFIDSANQVIEIEDGIVKDHSKDEEEYPITNYSNESKLPLKELIKFSFKCLKNSRFKLALNCLLFSIAFTLLLTSLFTLLFNEANARYNVYKDSNIEYICYYNQYVNSYGDNAACGFTNEEIKENLKDNRRFKIFTYTDSFGLEAKCAYITNTCDYPMLYGKNTISSGEIIISESIAKRISNTNNLKEVLNNNIKGLTIVGIYKDLEIGKKLDINGFVMSRLNNNIFILEEDYKQVIFNTDSIYFSFGMNNHNLTETLHIYKNEALKDNEIIIDSKYKEAIGEKLDLISRGEKYFVRKEEDYFITSYSNILYEETGFNIYVSENIYEKFQALYLQKFSPYIGIKDYTVKDIQEILNANMDIISDLEASIDDAMKNKTIIASIDAAFGFVICILTIVSLLNFMNNSINQSKREMGILLSLGFKKKYLSTLFIPSTLLLFLISTLLSTPLGIILFHVQKNLINQGLNIPIHYGYITLWAIPLFYFVILLIIGVILILLIHNLKKKNTIDFIYEK
jgi:ABC-type lipoprotein export system ATPase subunit/ABC-type antimicrobial peptide transport system permease subunit